MMCDLFSLATQGVAGLQPYHPGKPVEELERELGLRNIVKLASNENPLGPSAQVIEAIGKEHELSRYPDGNGFELKKALARFHQVGEEQITLGNGSNDLLELVARAFVTVKHQVIYAQHSFAVYPIVTQAIGAEHVVIDAVNWGHDLVAMAKAVTDRTRLMFIANPNNPTGTWVDAATIKTLLDTVPGRVIVVLDEAYYEYAKSQSGYPDSLALLPQYPNLVITRTFSKAYGLAGLRVGYALSHPDIADLLNRVRQPFNVNTLAQVAARVALDDPSHIEESVKLNATGMAQLNQAFDSLGLHSIPSAGNFICVNLQQPGQDVYQALLKEGVIVRPIDNYGMPEHLRITIGLEQENNKFITALAKVLAK